MNIRHYFLMLFVILLVLAPASSAQQHNHPGGIADELGEVKFSTSCDAAVQKDFNRAVAMLHSFWYGAAEKAFRAIRDKDPKCAMAYWGIAMSRFHQLWEQPDQKSMKLAREALQSTESIPNTSARERAYIEALKQYYARAEQDSHLTGMKTYQKAMEELQRRYPNDTEALIFYSLSLLGTAYSSPADKNFTLQKKAGKILEVLFAKQPNHPGLAHYIIHSYDYPPLAEKALEAARRYAKIAPDAPHALHMPSHIFTRLGLWQESISSNKAAAAAARRHGWTGEQLHATDYLTYANLQGAQESPAREILDALAVIKSELKPGTPNYSAGVFAAAAIPARYAVERKEWEEAARLLISEGFFPREKICWAEAPLDFARGLGAARSGQPEKARQSLGKLEDCKEIVTQASEAVWINQVEVQRRAVAAWIAFAESRIDSALSLMRAAAELEENSDKPPITPGAIAPSRELFGEMLLDANRPEEALQAFEASLQVAPNRFWSLYGAAKAAEKVGNEGLVRKYYSELLDLARFSDANRAELEEAKNRLR